MGTKTGEIEDELLQRYFDGEVTDEERARVEAALGEDEQLKLAALGEVRDLLRGTLTAEAESFDVWPSLARQLSGADDLSRARQKHALPKWMRSRYTQISAGISAFAAAAALLFVFQPWHAERSDNDCDIVHLETSGSVATVFSMNDVPHGGDGPTTVIWTEEQD